MSDGYGAGSLEVSARLSGSRTIVERVRYDGIVRCSRPFRNDDAALIVLSQLGPGVVRGDALTMRGHVRAGAHLIVTSQSATRLMGGPARANAATQWVLDRDATLDLIGEPLIANDDARYTASTTIDVGEGARVLVSELSRVPAGAHVLLRTSIRRGTRELFYDALDASLAAPYTVGTLIIVGLASDAAAALLSAFDRIADAPQYAVGGTSIGIGSINSGVFARLIGTDLWSVRETLATFRSAARAHMRPPS